jgi:hypothetical protein
MKEAVAREGAKEVFETVVGAEDRWQCGERGQL